MRNEVVSAAPHLERRHSKCPCTHLCSSISPRNSCRALHSCALDIDLRNAYMHIRECICIATSHSHACWSFISRDHSINQLPVINQLINQPVNEATNQTNNQTNKQLTNQPADQSISQPINQSVTHPSNQNSSQLASQPTPTNQPTCQRTD